MKNRWPLLFACLLPAFPATASRAADPAEDTEAYRRILDRAIDRAQTRLQERLEIGQDHSDWVNAWEVESEHYLVRSTHSRFLAAELAQGLEQMLEHFQRILRPEWQPTRRFPIFVFPDIAAYNNFGNTNGAEHSSFYGSFYEEATQDRAVAMAYDENRTLLKMQATHSALHQFVADASAQPLPTWVSEGLASYFALFWNFNWGIAEFRRIADGGTFIEMPDLLNAPIAAYTGRTHERFIQLGMLFAYLLNYREESMTAAGEGQGPGPFARALQGMLDGSGPTTGVLRSLFGEGMNEFYADFRAFEFGG